MPGLPCTLLRWFVRVCVSVSKCILSRLSSLLYLSHHAADRHTYSTRNDKTSTQQLRHDTNRCHHGPTQTDATMATTHSEMRERKRVCGTRGRQVREHPQDNSEIERVRKKTNNTQQALTLQDGEQLLRWQTQTRLQPTGESVMNATSPQR